MRGDVDADGKSPIGVPPGQLRQVAYRCPEDVVAELVDGAGLLSQRDELVGSDRAEFRMSPPEQRFDAADAPGREVHDRLVSQRELSQLGSRNLFANPQSANGRRTVGAERSVTSIVQQNYVSTADLRTDFLLDKFRRSRLPVVPGYIPHDRFETQLPGDPKHCRPSATPWRTEQI